MTDLSNAPNIIIAEGVVVNGVLSVPGEAVINGYFKGELRARSVVIGAKGEVSGKVICTQIETHGHLEDDIECDALLIARTAFVEGTLSYKTIEIQKGARVSLKFFQKDNRIIS